MLGAVYSGVGQAAEGRAAADEVLRRYPTFHVDVRRQRILIKDSAMLEFYLTALRKVGLIMKTQRNM